jgi:hypothetical protein
MSGEDTTRKDGRDIDRVVEPVERLVPAVTWTQLQVRHPGADDDGIWFFWISGKPGEVQLESSTGMLPFTLRPTSTTAGFFAQRSKRHLE